MSKKNKKSSFLSAIFVPVLILTSGFLLIFIGRMVFSNPTLDTPPPKKNKEVVPHITLARNISSSDVPKEENENDFFDTTEETISEEELEERKQVRGEREKAVLDVYWKTQIENDSEETLTLFESLGISSFEELLTLSEDVLQNLTEEEEVLLRQYQQKARTMEWTKKELKAHNPTQIKDEKTLLKRRRALAEKGENIGGGLLAQLSDPYLPLPLYKETIRVLLMSKDKKAFKSLLHLFEQEQDVSRRIFLFEALAKLGKSKSLPYFLTTLEKGKAEEKTAVLNVLSETFEPGAEPYLKKILEFADPKLVDIARVALVELNTEESHKILKEALDTGKIQSLSVSD